jgi:hypothetical protein
MKTCIKCRVVKPLTEFNKDKNRKDGHRETCKACFNKARKEKYHANPEEWREKIYKYRQEHPDRVKKSKAEYYQRHKDKVDAQITAWREQNKQTVLDYQKRDYQKNKPRYFAQAAKRRTLHKRHTPSWYEKELVTSVYQKAAEYGFAVDHVVPINNPLVCGLHCWANLQLLDPSINKSKGNRHWPDMPE